MQPKEIGVSQKRPTISISKRGDDGFDDAFGQRRDRQEGVNFECGPDNRSARDVYLASA